MKLFSLWMASLLWILATSGALFAQATPDQPEEYTEPLGIAKEEWPYPYEVHFLSFEVEGEPVRMAYMDVEPEGEPTGETVVLLHGKNFFGAYWEATIDTLAQTGYRVVVPDQVGFGKSSKPAIHYSFDLLARHTAMLLDSLGVGEAAIVGHSMGGMLAVRFARTNPERTTHLVLENPIGLEDYRYFVPPQATEDVYENELAGGDPDAIRDFFQAWVVEWDPEIYEPYVEARARIALSGEYPRWAMASALTYQMIVQQPVRHEFHLLEPPTLLVIGQEDRTVVGRGYLTDRELEGRGDYPQLGQEAHDDIPDSRLVELEDVGHIPHLEVPDLFHDALLMFLEDADALDEFISR